jgi:hypothetical protein
VIGEFVLGCGLCGCVGGTVGESGKGLGFRILYYFYCYYIGRG